MSAKQRTSGYVVIGLKLLVSIAIVEFGIMLFGRMLFVDRLLSPLQFALADTVVLCSAATFFIFLWVIRPLKQTIENFTELEARLRSSETQYRVLFNDNPLPMLIYDRDSLAVLAVNDLAVDHYGWSREEFLAMGLTGLYPPLQHPAVSAAVQDVLGEIRRPGVWRQKKKDGTLIDVEVVTHDIVFAGRAARLALMNDVTLRVKAEKGLREALRKVEEEKAKSEAIIAAIGDGITIQDRDFKILYQNDVAKKMIGDHVGEYCYAAYEGNTKTCASCPVITAFEDGKVHTVVREVPRTGGRRYIENTASVLRDADGNIVAGIEVVRDISARKQAEERIQEQVRQLSALRAIDLAISSSLDIRVTLDVFLDQVVAQLRVDAACVLLLNRYSRMLTPAVRRGFRAGSVRQAPLRLGEGNAGIAALERSMVHVPDLRSDAAGAAVVPGGEQFISYYAVPLVARGEVKGVLELYHRSPFHPEPGWQDFVEGLALQAAIAIDNTTLFENIERSNLELAQAYDTTIEGWSRALDYRDKETEGHSRRVTDLTVEICTDMGMGEESLTYVRWGALLHDIGKLGVPDAILFKPGKLDDDEWALMKRHPLIAYELLSPIRYLGPAVDIPYCHHEKWDGTGYPRGLKGDQIPLAARVFAVVDIWDALRSDRPYRPAWSEERVVEHLRGLAGSHLDAAAVAAFLARNPS